MKILFCIIALAIFLSILFLEISLWKNNKKKTVIISVLAVIITGLISGYLLFHRKSDEVWVNGISQPKKFLLNIENQKIVSNGYIDSFRSNITKDQLLEELQKNYPNYKENGDSITIFYKNEYFNIDILSQGNVNSYKLYADYIKYFDEENDVIINIPFPEESVWYKQYLKSKFSTTYTLEQLKEYYEPFDNVKIKDNIIKIETEDVKVKLAYYEDNNKVKIKKYELKK